MCGIAGIFDVKRSKKFDRVTLARELLLAIERRGRHATGYAYVDVDDATTIVEKADLPASDFVEAAPIFVDGLLRSTPRALLLHTRYATQGKPANNYNNHPIYSKVSGLTLIHNGWLTNEKAIIEKYNLRKDGEVDSETVLRLIEHFVLNERKRIITAIKLAMRELEGVFACALISEKYPDTLWLWRSGNPLVCYLDDATGAFIFASTEELLTQALHGAGIHPRVLMSFPQDHVACLTISKGKLQAAFKKLRKHRKPKKQEPIKNTFPFIAMPSSFTAIRERIKAKAIDPNLVEKNAPTATKKGWEKWKEQGKEIDALLKGGEKTTTVYRRRNGEKTKVIKGRDKK